MNYIVRTNEPDYVPPGVKVRSRIFGNLFTTTLTDEQATEVKKDPKVVGIEAGRRLATIKAPQNES